MKRITYTRQDFGLYRGDCYNSKKELKEAIESAVGGLGGFYSQNQTKFNLEPGKGQKGSEVLVPPEKTKEEIERDIEREVEEAWKKAEELWL